MSGLDSLWRAVIRRGWSKGVQGGSRAWTVAGGVALIGWLAGRALRRSEEVVFREKLPPGQSIRITHEG